jgi:hypothetical protein
MHEQRLFGEISNGESGDQAPMEEPYERISYIKLVLPRGDSFLLTIVQQVVTESDYQNPALRDYADGSAERCGWAVAAVSRKLSTKLARTFQSVNSRSLSVPAASPRLRTINLTTCSWK